MTVRTQTKPGAGVDPDSRFAGLRGAVVLFSCYPGDPRPRRATEALAAEGMEMEVLCLRSSAEEPSAERLGKVSVRRLPIRHSRGGKLTYLWQYGSFLLTAMFVLAVRSLRRRYSLVHVHNMPDILVFAAMVPKLLGAKVLLDLHDPMPELMMTIFNLPATGTSVRVLKRLERWSIAFADAAVTVNQACRRIFSRRSCLPEKMHVIMNSPDDTIFRYRPPDAMEIEGPRRSFVMMYHGTLVERNGLGLALEALLEARKHVPSIELRVFGRPTPYGERMREFAAANGLGESVRFLGERNLEQLVEEMDGVDVGIIPNKRSIFTEINTPTRIFEYLACGVPVIAPRAAGITDYFGDADLFYFELGNAADLARAILRVQADANEARRCVERGQAVYRTHCWSQERNALIALVCSLLGLPGGESCVLDQSLRSA